MNRAVRLSEIKGSSSTVQEKALAGIIAESRSPANSSVEAISEQIAGYEKRYGLDSGQLLEELSSGKREETEEILSWLMLIRLRERIEPTRTS